MKHLLDFAEDVRRSMDRSLAHRYARGGVRRRDLRTSLKVEKPAEDRKLPVPDDEFPIRAAVKSTIGRRSRRLAVLPSDTVTTRAPSEQGTAESEGAGCPRRATSSIPEVAPHRRPIRRLVFTAVTVCLPSDPCV
ncbi:MAG: hypothetical protein IT450_15205 [Phycisphaerales bacterium]|nr:hypothetical protein [Phycisphaerales bacterium]